VSGTISAAKIREDLGHPVLDNDGHILEHPEVLTDFVREVGGADAADRYEAFMRLPKMSSMGKRRANTLEERCDAWMGQTSFWSHTVNARDRATSMSPRFFVERLGELGIDFGILYPTDGLYANRIDTDTELRQIACRAVNTYQAELFKGCERHLMPVAVIPMATPEEAIAELEFAVNDLGYRTVLLTSGTRRSIPKVEREHPDLSSLVQRMDFYGMDSAYDYDPLWKRMVELRVAPTFHGQTVGTWFGPISPSNNTFNRLVTVGHQYPALLLAFLLGGVVKRFPRLKFMFQEGGAGWMASLYVSMLGIAMKRGGGRVENYNPARLDISELKRLVTEWGGDRERSHIDWIDNLTQDLVTPEVLDDFAAIDYSSAEEFTEVFVSHFYAGCEGDDFSNGFAYSKLPHGAQLRTTFGSDIGHWDVMDAGDCLPEAYELLEDGVLNASQLKAFLFDNAYEFYTSTNPDFFQGTTLEDYSGTQG
jgi:predicted TIM-barrel fold metal-dependent hydrolase